MAQAHAKPQHDYHLLNPSPWPLVGAFGGLVLALGALMFFMSKKAGDPHLWYILPGLAIVLITMFGWWRDVIKEEAEGFQSPVVQLHLRYGMILFIASEVMFFVTLVLGLARHRSLLPIAWLRIRARKSRAVAAASVDAETDVPSALISAHAFNLNCTWVTR